MELQKDKHHNEEQSHQELSPSRVQQPEASINTLYTNRSKRFLGPIKENIEKKGQYVISYNFDHNSASNFGLTHNILVGCQQVSAPKKRAQKLLQKNGNRNRENLKNELINDRFDELSHRPSGGCSRIKRQNSVGQKDNNRSPLTELQYCSRATQKKPAKSGKNSVLIPINSASNFNQTTHRQVPKKARIYQKFPIFQNPIHKNKQPPKRAKKFDSETLDHIKNKSPKQTQNTKTKQNTPIKEYSNGKTIQLSSGKPKKKDIFNQVNPSIWKNSELSEQYGFQTLKLIEDLEKMENSHNEIQFSEQPIQKNPNHFFCRKPNEKQSPKRSNQSSLHQKGMSKKDSISDKNRRSEYQQKINKKNKHKKQNSHTFGNDQSSRKSKNKTEQNEKKTQELNHNENSHSLTNNGTSVSNILKYVDSSHNKKNSHKKIQVKNNSSLSHETENKFSHFHEGERSKEQQKQKQKQEKSKLNNSHSRSQEKSKKQLKSKPSNKQFSKIEQKNQTQNSLCKKDTSIFEAKKQSSAIIKKSSNPTIERLNSQKNTLSSKNQLMQKKQMTEKQNQIFEESQNKKENQNNDRTIIENYNDLKTTQRKKTVEPVKPSVKDLNKSISKNNVSQKKTSNEQIGKKSEKSFRNQSMNKEKEGTKNEIKSKNEIRKNESKKIFLPSNSGSSKHIQSRRNLSRKSSQKNSYKKIKIEESKKQNDLLQQQQQKDVKKYDKQENHSKVNQQEHKHNSENEENINQSKEQNSTSIIRRKSKKLSQNQSIKKLNQKQKNQKLKSQKQKNQSSSHQNQETSMKQSKKEILFSNKMAQTDTMKDSSSKIKKSKSKGKSSKNSPSKQELEIEAEQKSIQTSFKQGKGNQTSLKEAKGIQTSFKQSQLKEEEKIVENSEQQSISKKQSPQKIDSEKKNNNNEQKVLAKNDSVHSDELSFTKLNKTQLYPIEQQSIGDREKSLYHQTQCLDSIPNLHQRKLNSHQRKLNNHQRKLNGTNILNKGEQKDRNQYSRAPILSLVYGDEQKFIQNHVDQFEGSSKKCCLEVDEEFSTIGSATHSIVEKCISILISIDTWLINRIFQPYLSKNGEAQCWLYCKGRWKPFLSKQTISIVTFFNDCLKQASSTFYNEKDPSQLGIQQILRMITGLRVIQLKKNKKLLQIVQFNLKKGHILKGISENIKKPIYEIKQIKNTVNNDKLIQITKSKSKNLHDHDKNSQYEQTDNNSNNDVIWVKEDIFQKYFDYFLLICYREQSKWTSKKLKYKQNHTNIFTLDSLDSVNGSIEIHSNEDLLCEIDMYREIKPKVLKFVGKIKEKHKNRRSVNSPNPNAYFDFTIKGRYYIFVTITGQIKQNVHVSLEASDQIGINFLEQVKNSTLKNQNSEYVEVGKKAETGEKEKGKNSSVKEQFIDYLVGKSKGVKGYNLS